MTNDKIYKAAKKYATKNLKPYFTSDIYIYGWSGVRLVTSVDKRKG